MNLNTYNTDTIIFLLQCPAEYSQNVWRIVPWISDMGTLFCSIFLCLYTSIKLTWKPVTQRAALDFVVVMLKSPQNLVDNDIKKLRWPHEYLKYDIPSNDCLGYRSHFRKYTTTVDIT